MYSSGDSGYEGPGEDPVSPTDQVDYPTSSPYVTSVGGTSLAISETRQLPVGDLLGHRPRPADPPQERRQEVAVHPAGQVPRLVWRFWWWWREHRVRQPSYQAGVVPTSLATKLPDGTTSSTPMRVVPDVSALADPSTGMLFGETILRRTGRPTASRSAGSAAPAWPARRSPASRRTPSRRPVAHSGSPTRRSTTWTRTFAYGIVQRGVQRRDRPPARRRATWPRCGTTTPTRTPSRARC